VLNFGQDIASGRFSVLIVQAEQLFVDKGHFPRVARLLSNRKFIKKIIFLMVDEAHCIYTMGTSLYGLPAFRPAWNYLAELRTKLGSKVAVAALSGTLPKHIKNIVKQRLQLDNDNLCNIKLSCNWPNISYAIHEIVGELSDYRNLNFLLPNNFDSAMDVQTRKKGIVFHDSVEGAIAAKYYHERCLPAEQRGKGIIRHYCSIMSEEYLQTVYDDFRNPDGVCQILHATEAASTV
jgi:superfamily II DNA helicase RecQ